MNIREISERLQEFADERDWNQFHSPKNLAMALSVEASELVELFQWSNSGGEEEAYRDGKPDPNVIREIADIMIFLIRFTDVVGIDLEEAVYKKIDENGRKYPVETAKGNATKYNRRNE
tara:strand:+ start:122 stop:478 length:357 start_codon:yes stop_codon:yes gene_type:complete